jgi:tRNA (mo5U34)-methyltransferase
VTVPNEDWLRSQIEKEEYWFLQIDLGNGLMTPGWSNPKTDKLPYFGLPDEMSGMRVLDIGCAEGFFSFEAERRGAREVIAIDPFPETIRRFNICRSALDSNVTGVVASVYDLDPRSFGTFDLVMFFGVLYHLRHPLLGLQKVASVTAGTVRLQTQTFQFPPLSAEPIARFYPKGVPSGPPDNPIYDDSVFWRHNEACVLDMMLHVGFVEVEPLRFQEPKAAKHTFIRDGKQKLATRWRPNPAATFGNTVFRAQSATQAAGVAPARNTDGALGGAGRL